MAVVYQSHFLFLARAVMQLSVMQTCCLEVQSGKLVMGDCQVQKLLFPCVTGALPVLTRSLSHLVCPQTQSVPPAPSLLALCPQSDVRKAEHLPQKLSCAGPQGPALLVCANLLQTPVVSELIFRDC